MNGLVSLLALLTNFSYNPPDTTIRGVGVIFTYSRTIFPALWQEEPINALGEPILAEEKGRSRAILQLALDKYPEPVLNRDLKNVYFLKTMKFYDVAYGGTNSNDALYLTNNGKSNGYSDLYLEQTFHHEYSSILFRNHPSFLNERLWLKANTQDFAYTDPEQGIGAIRNNQSSQDLDTALCNIGLLTQYASSGMENDINTYAQNLFSPSTGFWDIVEKYPRVKKKVKLLVAFYSKINPVFTMSYFRKLDQD